MKPRNLKLKPAHSNDSTTLQPLNAAIVEAIQEVKGLDIVQLDLTHLKDASADFFIVCSGTSTTHVMGIVDRIEKLVSEKMNVRPAAIEGKIGRSWVLVDYFSVMVHVFTPDKREMYDLEDLWNDAKVTRIDDEA